MKRYLLLFLIICLALAGCAAKDQEVKGQIDLKGVITEVDREGNRVLVNDADVGLVWLTLPVFGDISTYEAGQGVVVWIDGGIKESSPASAKALNILVEAAQSTSHPFDYTNHSFPPNPSGVVTIGESSYDMVKGGFEWTKGDQTVLTDAASPTQIAETFKAIVVEPISKVSIKIEQNPDLRVYLWEAE